MLENLLFLFMIKGWKTHSNKEDRDEKHAILIDGWKTHSKRKKNRVGKHTIFSLQLRVGKQTQTRRIGMEDALSESMVKGWKHTQRGGNIGLEGARS